MIVNYFISHYKTYVMLLIFCGIFAIVFMLFNLPVIAVLYAALICAVVGLPIIAYDIFRYTSRHNALRQVLQSRTTEGISLPEPRGTIEKDMRDIIARLCREKAEMRSEYDAHFTALDDYYTLWAHQIKTPIAAMSVLLQQDSAPDKAMLSGELFKIERYVELVLQYIRLDSISQDLRLCPVNIGSTVRQAVKKYAALFIHSKLALFTENLDTKVISDEKWLCFMIEQIISNAIKYTPSGKISIYSDNKALFIEDTGIGISAEDLPRIFERGFTGAIGRRDKKSTGLGLYLCSRVADKLSIKISAESDPGKGTRIIMVFPDKLPVE